MSWMTYSHHLEISVATVISLYKYHDLLNTIGITCWVITVNIYVLASEGIQKRPLEYCGRLTAKRTILTSGDAVQ